MRNRFIVLIAALVATITARGQVFSDALPTSKELALPNTVIGMTVVDGSIYCSTKSLALHVRESNGMLSSVIPNRVVSEDKATINYATRDPQSGELFYTKKSLFGVSRLYQIQKATDGSSKNVQIKPGGRNIAVEHPTIAENGEFMVFSAKSGDSHGGKDLYVSVKTAQGWSMPKNLDSINTLGDETCPSFWNGYLFFTSDGQASNFGGTDLYALKLNATMREVDSAHSEVNISYGKLQHLPYPFNSERNERAIIVNNGRTYVAKAGDSTAMGDILTSYDCTPDMVTLTGTVRDKKGHPQPRTRIVLQTNDRKRSETTTDGDGRYQLFLRKDKSYEITYSKVTFGNEKHSINTTRESNEKLVDERLFDVELTSFDPGQYFELQTLFGDDASIELTAEGYEKLAPIVAFISGNQGVEVQMTMYCGLSRDAEFNQILAEKRAQAVKDYLNRQVPGAENLSVTSGGDISGKKKTANINDLLTIKLGLF